MDLEGFRRSVPILKERTYLFAGMVAPMTTRVAAAMDRWRVEWAANPLDAFNVYRDELEHLRRVFSRLIGATPAEIGVVGNTSEGSNRIIGMLARRPRPVVLVDDTTYPTMIYPWITKTDKQIEYIDSEKMADTNWLGRRLDRGDVLALAVSHVGNFTGFRHDLRALGALTRATGTCLVVDAAQSTGLIPLDVVEMGVDALATTSLKWLLGPPGVGLMYMSRELLEELPLADCGYAEAQFDGIVWPRSHLPHFPPTGASLELGVPAVNNLAAVSAGIELVMEVGVESIEARVSLLMASLWDILDERGFDLRTPRAAERRGGVLAGSHPRAEELAEFLRTRAVDIGGFAGGKIRVDPHGYNNQDDVHRFEEGLDSFLVGTARWN